LLSVPLTVPDGFPQNIKPLPNQSLERVSDFTCAPHWIIFEPIYGGFKPYIQAKVASGCFAGLNAHDNDGT
jgi:hypothetical protein